MHVMHGQDIRFSDVLGSKISFLLFVEHLEKEFSVENILFLIEIAKFREHYLAQIVPKYIEYQEISSDLANIADECSILKDKYNRTHRKHKSSGSLFSSFTTPWITKTLNTRSMSLTGAGIHRNRNSLKYKKNHIIGHSGSCANLSLPNNSCKTEEISVQPILNYLLSEETNASGTRDSGLLPVISPVMINMAFKDDRKRKFTGSSTYDHSDSRLSSEHSTHEEDGTEDEKQQRYDTFLSLEIAAELVRSQSARISDTVCSKSTKTALLNFRKSADFSTIINVALAEKSEEDCNSRNISPSNSLSILPSLCLKKPNVLFSFFFVFHYQSFVI